MINVLEGIDFNYNVCVRCICINPSVQVWMGLFLMKGKTSFALSNYFWIQEFICHRCRNSLKSFNITW